MQERESKTNRVFIRLFGPLEVRNIHGQVSENPSRESRPWMLLKYLLVNRGREVEQRELLEKVWPNTTEQEGDSACRVRLKRVRESLAPLELGGIRGLILFSKGRYSLNPACEVETDAEVFLALLEQVRAAADTDPEGLKRCGEALELFREPYMKYCSAPWVEPQRRYYRERFRELAGETLRRSRALNDDSVLQILSVRAAAILPEEQALHREIISYLTEKRKESCLVRYIMLLSNDAPWLSELRFDAS